MKRGIMKLLFTFFVVMLIFVCSYMMSKAQETGLPPLKVVQLGDSYSAGNGARAASGDRNYSGVSECYRSPTNWGSQFVRSLRDVFSVTYLNRACSGGVIADILNNREMDKSLKKINGSCPTPEYPQEEFYTDDSTFQCTRRLRPQIEAIDSSVDLVLMTMGGNDVQFATIVKQCFVKGYRDPADCRAAVENANTDLADVEVDLTDVFKKIRSKLRPAARVVFVAYPYLAPDINYQLKSGDDIYNAAQEIRTLGLEGDRRQKAAVEAANAAAGEEYIIFYDGTKKLFDGHIPNPSETNSAQWLFGTFDTRIPIEWYHYNPLGHQNLGSALSILESIDLNGTLPQMQTDIDVAFVVDATGSMADEIAQVQADLSRLVNQLAATTNSYRVALVSYRDFPERTGESLDYPFKVDLTFTNELGKIQAAIDALTAEGGGDPPETVFSGIQAAVGLPWRPGVTKIAIVIGDAPALSPEPISNLTSAQVVANSIAVDPIKVIGVNINGGLDLNGALGEISVGTGGTVITNTSELTATISGILNQVTKQPFAWLGNAYSGRIGQPIVFDASGSYDPSGVPIGLYEWDFNGDGKFDFATKEITATHVYTEAFNDFAVLRVTGKGGIALASARTVVNAEGFASQGDEESCARDENGFSIIVDSVGRFINCTADNLPKADKEGVEAPTALGEVNEPIRQLIFLPLITR